MYVDYKSDRLSQRRIVKSVSDKKDCEEFSSYSRKGSRFSVVLEAGVPRRDSGVVGTPVSDASDFLRSSLDVAVC